MIRRVQNIYYMLAYAFRVLHEKGYRDVASEEFENGLELLAAILCRGVSTQIKRGLTRQYLTQEETLSVPRGKIEINASIRTLTNRKKQLVCACDEFSVDAYPNRIIKTTLSVLLRSNLSRPRKKELRRLLAFFDGVTPLDIHTINWNIPYDRNNQTYRMILAVCQMLLKGILQTESAGAVRMMEYLDDQSMAKLYERFILGYYRREHPALKAYAPQIKWAVTDGYAAQLPAMQTDIVLSSRETGKTLIIDAKYYAHNMQMKVPYTARTVHSNNLYQIFAYVKNWPAAPDESVAGLLLYAGTDDEIQPDNDYQISGNTISVKTLDLDCDFTDIAKSWTRLPQGLHRRANAPWRMWYNDMIILIAGASHTGKTLLAQRLLEKYGYPYLSIDHLKMGLIRSGYTSLTPESRDRELTDYLWPVVREIIKTAIENRQNLIVEGCYIPFDWARDFGEAYRFQIQYRCLVMSEAYIRAHYSDIKKYASTVEHRVNDEDCTLESLLQDNAEVLEQCREYGVEYTLIDETYQVDIGRSAE